MSRERILVLVAIVAAVVAGVTIGALAFGDDGGSDDAAPATSTTADDDRAGDAGGTDDGDGTDDAEPGGDDERGEGDVVPPTTLDAGAYEGAARELAAAINRASELTYHARYEGVDHDIAMEIWRRPPRARRDTTVRDGEGGSDIFVSEHRLADGTHLACLPDALCVEPGAGDDAVDPADPVIGAVDPGAGQVQAYDDTVRGVPVRCFDVVGGGEEGADATACFDAEGIPMVLDGGDGRLERTDLGRGVPDDVLEPSEPVEANPTTTAPSDPS